MGQFDEVARHIERETGDDLSHYQTSSVSGGSINTAIKLYTPQLQYFIKLNHVNLLAMFEAEAQGLQALAATNTLRIPNVICLGQTANNSYLVLEHIELTNLHGRASAEMGTQLAKLHQQTQPFFGWHIDNTIGSTKQYNHREHDWLTFWQQHRLGQQLNFAAKNGYTGRLQDKGQQLLTQLPHFFDGYDPQPALLHGDLWGGNFMVGEKGEPIIIDPAVYYGHREMDLAMSQLFGGFSSEFYTSYNKYFPLEKGWQKRMDYCNLYPLLVHVNLFGGGYAASVSSIISRF